MSIGFKRNEDGSWQSYPIGRKSGSGGVPEVPPETSQEVPPETSAEVSESDEKAEINDKEAAPEAGKQSKRKVGA
jgi:hypothetical protein